MEFFARSFFSKIMNQNGSYLLSYILSFLRLILFIEVLKTLVYIELNEIVNYSYLKMIRTNSVASQLNTIDFGKKEYEDLTNTRSSKRYNAHVPQTVEVSYPPF